MIGSTPNNVNRLNAEVVVPLKYLSSFWRSLDLPLINCEIELDLSWSRYCIISEISRAPVVPANPNANPPVPATTFATFQINNTKLCVLVVTLSINDNIKFLENIKQRFKRTISWNKYRSEITTQPNNNNIDYLIDPTFRNINRLFVLSFKNGDNDPTRGFFDKFYIPLVKINNFNALIDYEPFFDQPVKANKEHMKTLVKFQEKMTIQQGIYYIFHIIKIIINSLVQIHQHKQIPIFFKKLILPEN